MEVECNFSEEEQSPTDISRLLNNNNNSAHLVRSLGSQRTHQCMSEAKVAQMKSMHEEIAKKRAELAESIKVLLKEGYKKEIRTEFKEALYDFLVLTKQVLLKQTRVLKSLIVEVIFNC